MEGKLANKDKEVAWDADPFAGIVPRFLHVSCGLIAFAPLIVDICNSSDCFPFRALGQMFDKLNCAEQGEETESVVKVQKLKIISKILIIVFCEF